MDLDNSGSISYNELRIVLEGDALVAEVEEEDPLDHDHRMKLMNEFFEKLEAYAHKKVSNVTHIFRQFDKDASGSFDHDEISKACRHLMADHDGSELSDMDIKAIIQTFDVNRDGRIQYRELTQILREFKMQRRAEMHALAEAEAADTLGDLLPSTMAPPGGREDALNHQIKLRIHPDILALRRQLHKCHVTTGQLFAEMDADRGNEVSFREFARGLAMSGIRPVPSTPHMEHLFAVMDVDSSGNIGFQELQVVLEGDAEAVARATRYNTEAISDHQRILGRHLKAGTGHGGTVSPSKSARLQPTWGMEYPHVPAYAAPPSQYETSDSIPVPPPPPPSFKAEILAFHSDEIEYRRRRQVLMRKAGTPPLPRPVRKRDSGTLGLGSADIQPHAVGLSSVAFHPSVVEGAQEESSYQTSFRGQWRQ